MNHVRTAGRNLEKFLPPFYADACMRRPAFMLITKCRRDALTGLRLDGRHQSSGEITNQGFEIGGVDSHRFASISPSMESVA